MSTKLSVFCNKVIEAGWLTAVIVVPLTLNVYTQRTFEPDKIILLRSIALVMALAWLIKTIEEEIASSHKPLLRNLAATQTSEVSETSEVCPPVSVLAHAAARHGVLAMTQAEQLPRERVFVLRPSSFVFLRTPLVVPALLLALVYIFTAVTSIVPRLSFWGSYQRLQGTYTTLSYLVIFFLSLQTLRTKEQLERLIAVVLLTSLPVSLYGIMQHYGLDPIIWSGEGLDVTLRVISTMGNPIFVAAYLSMVVPLTLGQLVCIAASPGGRAASPGRVKHYLLAGYYVLLLVVQLLCIFFTQSRGPLLGLLGGIFFFFLLLAIVRGKRQFVIAVVAVAILLGLFLFVLNLPQSPLEPIRQMPYVGRLGQVFDMQSRTGRQRILAWEGTINLITADPVRALIGYGPESLIVAFNPHFPPELASLIIGTTFDRSHNETLDVLATTGLIGLAVYLLLFASLFYYGLKWLGLVQSSRQQLTFFSLWLGGGLAGALLPWLLEGKWRLAGVGLPLGAIAGLAIYLILYPLSRPQKEDTDELHRSIILSALFAAIMAHFIEIQFGIAIVATRTYFWLYAALLVVVGFFGRELVPAVASREQRAKSKGQRASETSTPSLRAERSNLHRKGKALCAMRYALCASATLPL
jgi:O-antigen ligase